MRLIGYRAENYRERQQKENNRPFAITMRLFFAPCNLWPG
jgi:hypothetical protein